MAAYPFPLVSVQVTSSQGPHPSPHRPFPSVHSLSYDQPLRVSLMVLTTCGLTHDVCAHLCTFKHCYVHVSLCTVHARAHLCTFMHCLCTQFLYPTMCLFL